MLFHTWTFLIFLAVVLPVLFALRRTRLWIPWLLVASYTFYGWWNPYYLGLLFGTSAIDYAMVLLMDRSKIQRTRKLWLGFDVDSGEVAHEVDVARTLRVHAQVV